MNYNLQHLPWAVFIWLNGARLATMPPSRRTTSQIISLGQYLDADFDPTSLTVPQMLGILLYHKVKYPTRYSKKELVHIFNNKIKPRSAVFKNERITQENVTGSDDGIKDDLTGLSPTPVQYVMFIVISVPSLNFLPQILHCSACW